MKRRLVIMTGFLVALGLLGVAPRVFAGDEAKQDKKTKEEKKKGEKGKSKEKSSGDDLRDGVNRAFDGFKKETDKGKKNLNDLYEREKAKQGS